MESGDYINKLTKVLNRYYATLTRLSSTDATVDSVSMTCGRRSSYTTFAPTIDCEITFHDFVYYKDFVNDLNDIGNEKDDRRKLHDQYPNLRIAYEEYITLEKLYGG